MHMHICVHVFYTHLDRFGYPYGQIQNIYPPRWIDKDLNIKYTQEKKENKRKEREWKERARTKWGGGKGERERERQKIL